MYTVINQSMSMVMKCGCLLEEGRKLKVRGNARKWRFMSDGR